MKSALSFGRSCLFSSLLAPFLAFLGYSAFKSLSKRFAVVRDEIACKPAVIAETNNYVAIASEFQAMAHLPDVNNAKIFEPEPGVVYSWGN